MEMSSMLDDGTELSCASEEKWNLGVTMMRHGDLNVRVG